MGVYYKPLPALKHECVVQILRLGFDGYKRIMINLMRVAGHLQDGLLATGAKDDTVHACGSCLLSLASFIWHQNAHT